MKKYFLALAALLLATPFLIFADSYDGPYCFEDPTQHSVYNDDSHIRGTCKSVEFTTVVSLDTSLQNDYLLAQHEPLIDCAYWLDYCYKTRRSEIIQPTTTPLIFANKDVAMEYQDYDYTTGKAKPEAPIFYEDTAIILDKKYVLDYIESVYKQSGIKLENNKFPQIVLMDRDEIIKNKEIYSYSQGQGRSHSYNDILALFKGKNDPLYIEVGKGFFGNDYSPSIYTFNYSDFGKHIYSLKGSLAEYHYVDFDKTKLPSQDIEVINVYKSRMAYVVPVTSPIKSVKNYWIFTKKDGKVVLAWQKSEYGLDNGKISTVSNENIKINGTPLTDTNITPSFETNNVPTSLPSEQKKSFFSRFLDRILSWFK